LEPVVYNIEIIESNNEIIIASPGPQGPQGLQGEPGVFADIPVTIFSFTWEQQTNEIVWTIQHNLGYRPNVSIIDYGRNNIEADISHVDVNELTITFTSATSGYAYLS
jgi:hypothetical protein